MVSGFQRLTDRQGSNLGKAEVVSSILTGSTSDDRLTTSIRAASSALRIVWPHLIWF